MAADAGRSIVVSPGGDQAGDREGHRQAVVVEAVGRGAAERGRRPRCAMSSPSTSIRAPSARRPAAIPAIRSDSLWRSSPAPRMTVVPGRGRRRRGTGPGSRRWRRPRRPDRGRSPRSVDERTTRSASGSPTPSSGSVVRDGRSSMSRAHRAQDVDDRAAGRVDADVAQGQLGVGMDGAGDQPEGRRRDVARDPLVDRVHRHPSLHRPGDRPVRRVRPLDRHAPRPEHPLRVVARRDRLADRRPPVRPKPGQQDRRLHLCARHRRRVVDGPERGTTDHGQGREGVVPSGLEHRAHRAQRFDDTSHRTAAQ